MMRLSVIAAGAAKTQRWLVVVDDEWMDEVPEVVGSQKRPLALLRGQQVNEEAVFAGL